MWDVNIEVEGGRLDECTQIRICESDLFMMLLSILSF